MSFVICSIVGQLITAVAACGGRCLGSERCEGTDTVWPYEIKKDQINTRKWSPADGDRENWSERYSRPEFGFGNLWCQISGPDWIAKCPPTLTCCNNAFFVLRWMFPSWERHTKVVYTCQLLTSDFSTFTALFVFTVDLQDSRVKGRRRWSQLPDLPRCDYLCVSNIDARHIQTQIKGNTPHGEWDANILNNLQQKYK